jgi:hypothetical protein
VLTGHGRQARARHDDCRPALSGSGAYFPKLTWEGCTAHHNAPTVHVSVSMQELQMRTSPIFVSCGVRAVGLVALLGGCSSIATPSTASTRPAAAATSAPAVNASTTTPPTSPTTTRTSAPAVTTTGSSAPSSAATTQAPEALVPGDIPDDQVFVSFSPPSGGYRVKVPEGWARSTDGSVVVFTDKFNTIRIETVPEPIAPTIESVTATDLPALAGTTRGYVVGKTSAVTRRSGQAILSTYRSDAPPNSVTDKAVRLDVERYVFWRSGQAVILTLSSSVGSDNVDPWKTVTDGFAWVP